MKFSYRLPAGIRIDVLSKREPPLLRTMLGPSSDLDDAPDIQLDLDVTKFEATLARGAYKGIGWRIDPIGVDDRWRIAFAAAAFTPYLALHIALLPALRRVLASRDMALVPAAAFSVGGEAALILGATASGKTTALLRAFANGAGAIGDEYVALDRDGVAHALFRGLALRRGASDALPAIHTALPRRDRLLLDAFAFARAASFRRLQPLLHVPWSAAAVQHQPSAQTRRVWRLDASSSSARDLSVEDAIAFIDAHLAAHDAAYGDPLATISPAPDASAILRAALERAERRIGSAGELAATLRDPARSAAR